MFKKTRIQQLLARAQRRHQVGDLAGALRSLDKACAIDPADPVLLCARGMLHIRLGQPAQAHADFSAAIRSDPACAPAYAWRGHLCYDSLESWRTASRAYIRNALDDCQRAIELDATIPQAYLGRAHCRCELEGLGGNDLDWSAIEADYATAITLAPDNPKAYEQRAWYFHSFKEEPDNALADLQRAIERAPNDPNYNFLRARVYAESNDGDRAIEELTRALQKPQRSGHLLAEILMLRGRLYDEDGAYDRATADYREGLRVSRDPRYRKEAGDYEDSFVSLLEHLADQDRSEAMAKRLDGLVITILRDVDTAGTFVPPISREDVAQAIREATKPDPVSLEPETIMLRAAIKRPTTTTVVLDIGLHNGTIKIPLQAIGNTNATGTETMASQPASERIRQLVDAGNWDGALAELNDAVEQAPDDIKLLMQRAHVLAKRDNISDVMDDRQSAIADLTLVILLEPSHAQAYIARAWIYRELTGDLEHAMADLRNAITHAPDSAVAHAMMGRCHKEQLNDRHAIAELSEAIRLDPGNGEFYNWRGTAHYRPDGDIEAAEQDFLKALELRPADTEMARETHGYLACIYEKRGQFQSAEAHLEKALRVSDSQLHRDMYEAKLAFVRSKR